MNEDVIVALADPEGSGLYNKVPLRLSSPISWIADLLIQVKYGVMFDRKEAEGTKRRHQVDTVVEGMYVRTFDTLVLGSILTSEGRLVESTD